MYLSVETPQWKPNRAQEVPHLLKSKYMKINEIMAGLEARHPGEKEFHQAVREVLLSVEDVYNQHPEWEKARLIERMVEPDRIFPCALGR